LLFWKAIHKNTVCLVYIPSNFVLAMGKHIATTSAQNYILIWITTFSYPLVQDTAWFV